MPDDRLADDPFVDPADPEAIERERRRQEREERRRARQAAEPDPPPEPEPQPEPEPREPATVAGGETAFEDRFWGEEAARGVGSPGTELEFAL